MMDLLRASQKAQLSDKEELRFLSVIQQHAQGAEIYRNCRTAVGKTLEKDRICL